MNEAQIWVGLFGGFVGALVIFGLTIARDIVIERLRIRSHWRVLQAEISHCGRNARVFIDDAVVSPLYRLSTLCFVEVFPHLLEHGELTGHEASALIGFYNEVETFNRGLDETADALLNHNKAMADAQFQRLIQVKAPGIAEPDGELYIAATGVVARHLRRRI